MPTVNQNIRQIREAVYGRDVREAIADSIEQCYSRDGTGLPEEETLDIYSGVTISSFGVTEPDDGQNYTRLLTAIKTGKPVIIDTSFTVNIYSGGVNANVGPNISNENPRQIDNDVTLIGKNGATITFAGNITYRYNSIFVPLTGCRNIKLHNLHLISTCASTNVDIANSGFTDRLYLFNGMNSRTWKLQTISIKHCLVEGQIQMVYMSGDVAASPDEYGVDSLVIENNTFDYVPADTLQALATEQNVQDLHDIPKASFKRFGCQGFYLNTVRVTTARVTNNYIHNLGGVFLVFVSDDNAPYRIQFKKSRKVAIVSGNVVENDPEFWFNNDLLRTTYYGFIVGSVDELYYNHNRVKNLHSHSNVATYDIYGSANKLRYCWNEWINNLCTNEAISSFDNTMVKGKLGKDSVFSYSVFKVEQAFMTECGITLSQVRPEIFNFENFDSNGTVWVDHCIFDAPSARSVSGSSNWVGKKYMFTDNYFHFGTWDSEFLLPAPLCMDILVANNDIVLEDFRGKGIMKASSNARNKIAFRNNDVKVFPIWGENADSASLLHQMNGDVFVFTGNKITVIDNKPDSSSESWYVRLIRDIDFNSIDMSDNKIIGNSIQLNMNACINAIEDASFDLRTAKRWWERSQYFYIDTNYEVFDRTFYISARSWEGTAIDEFTTVLRLHTETDESNVTVMKAAYIDSENNAVDSMISDSDSAAVVALKNSSASSSVSIGLSKAANSKWKVFLTTSAPNKHGRVELHIHSVDNLIDTPTVRGGA